MAEVFFRHAMVSPSGSVGWKWTHDNQTAKMVIGDTDDHLKTRVWMMASGSQTPPALKWDRGTFTNPAREVRHESKRRNA